MPSKKRSTQLLITPSIKAQTVLIADDHDIFRHGLKHLLSKYSFLQVKGEVRDGVQLVKMVNKSQPDYIFMDLHMPDGHGLEAASEILEKFPGIKIIVLSFYNDALTVERLMKMGVMAYLTKNISLELLDAMFEKVIKGEKYMCPDAANNVAMQKISSQGATNRMQRQWQPDEISSREIQVLQLIVQGLSLKEIGKQMHLSSRTAESHKVKLMKKTGAKNMAELIFLAYEYKLV